VGDSWRDSLSSLPSQRALIWDVPADIESATLVVTPSDDDDGTCLAAYFSEGSMTFEIEFGG
jgi:hypothetical protein